MCPCLCGRTDFLLIRDSAGRISVRDFTGTVLAGQEEPRIRVPPPRSKEKKCAQRLMLGLRRMSCLCYPVAGLVETLTCWNMHRHHGMALSRAASCSP